MNTRVARCLAALLLLWPLLALANEFDIPELGMRLTAVPDSAAQPVVTERSGGVEATIHSGTAELNIFRDDTPVPAGSDVAEPSYRAILDEKFPDSVKSKSQGAPTAVGGHSAWTVVDAHENGSLTTYTCVTYVIVDQHLYRLLVSAAPAALRPPEFDGLVRAMSGVQFEQVHPPKAS